jgi:hypothetical protein
MTRNFSPAAICSPSTKEGSYIYKIVPGGSDSIGGISSLDELFLVNASTLDSATLVYFPNPPAQLSSLVPANEGQAVICAGGENIYVYDIRTQARVTAIKAGMCILEGFCISWLMA